MNTMSDNTKKRHRRKRTKAYRNTSMIINVIFICFIVIFAFIGGKHVFTDKKELREQGISLYNNGDYGEALVKFQKALEEDQWFSDEVNFDIEMYMADSYMRLENFSMANQIYVNITKNYDKGDYDEDRIAFMIQLTRALVDYSTGDYVTPLDILIMAVNRGYEEMALYVAICYENLYDTENMKAYYDIYSKNHGMNAYLCYKYAAYSIGKNDYSTALSFVEQGLSFNDADYTKELKYLQIICYKELGQYENAFNLSAAYMTAYPDDEKGRELYSYLDTRVNIDPIPVNDIYNIRDRLALEDALDDTSENASEDTLEDTSEQIE